MASPNRLVINHSASIVAVGYKPGEKNYKKSISFLPGVNEISAKDFENIESQSGFKRVLEAGTLEIKELHPEYHQSLAGYSVKDARTLIENTFDQNKLLLWLAAWQENETPKTIGTLLQKQIKTLKDRENPDQ